MSNSIAPGSSADVNVKVTALTTNPNVPVTYKTIILKKNLVNGVNTLTQEMMASDNTKYIIKYNYMLGEDITVLSNCILEFDGGSISGTNILSLSSTLLKGNVKISSELNGVLSDCQVLYSSWFPSLNKIFQLNISNTVLFIDNDITLDESIELKDNTNNFVLDGLYHTITLGVDFIRSTYNANNITLKNIKLNFNNESPSKSAFSFYPNKGYVQRNIVVENCYIYKCSLGIYFSKDAGGDIRNCIARNNKIIQEDTSSAITHYGINNSGEYTIIEGNYIEQNNRHAIYQTSYGYGTKIRNNTLYNCHQTSYSDMGIIFITRNSNNIIVEGNRFIKCNGVFIECGWSPFSTSEIETTEGGDLNNIVIQNNIFYNPKENSTRLVALGARTENGHYSKNIYFVKNIFCNISNAIRLIDFYDTKNLLIDKNIFDVDFSLVSENTGSICSLQKYEDYNDNIIISNNTFKIKGNDLIKPNCFLYVDSYAWQLKKINIVGNVFPDAIKSDGSLKYDVGSSNMWTTVFNDSRNSIREQIKKCGVSVERPILNDVIFNGVHFFDNTLNKDLTWDATNSIWLESDNAKAGVNRSGTFSNKPSVTDIYIGFKYFCTSGASVDEGTTEKTNISIYYTGNNNWVDANGNTVVAVS